MTSAGVQHAAPLGLTPYPELTLFIIGIDEIYPKVGEQVMNF
jgi:hypothetical protein